MLIHSNSGSSSSITTLQQTFSTNQVTSSSSSSSTLSTADNTFVATCSSPETSQTSTTENLNQPISPGLYSELAGVSCSTLSSIGKPQGVSSFNFVNGSALTENGKPEILYIGAEYCPYCAAERWSLIVALSKFGVFSNLEYMMSSSSDIYPNTPTFTFLNASYSSPYISLVTVEAEDRNREPLQPISSTEQAVFNQYDSEQSIPFVDISNQFVVVTSQYSPSVLSGATWNEVASQLNYPSSTYAMNIDGAANVIISDICAVDGNNPSTICNQSFAGAFLLTPIYVGSLSWNEMVAAVTLIALPLSSIWSIWSRGLKHSPTSSFYIRQNPC
jgi:thiol-disulfide isomerase/thioredoxin